MRLASPEVAPLRFGSYAEALGRHLDDLDRQAIRKRRQTMVPEQTDAVAVSGNLEGVRRALDDFALAGDALDTAFDDVVARQDLDAATRLSQELLQIEHGFLSEEGLPNRPWFRNLIWAPGLTTGYAPWPFPEIAEAIEDGNQELFDAGIRRVIDRLNETSQLMRAAAAN
jgi:N-acetylated-alpha-linked acidic dipeptidase